MVTEFSGRFGVYRPITADPASRLQDAELWHRTKQTTERTLPSCAATGASRSSRSSHPPPANSAGYHPSGCHTGKAAEMQRRGAIHLHALIRLDGAPPPGITLADL